MSVFDSLRALFRVPEPEVSSDYQCHCHERMGNDFWFLPADQCLRNDKTCSFKANLWNKKNRPS